MKLTNNASQKLGTWIAASTWHTNDLSDMNRWFDFVDQFLSDGCDVDEAALREIVEHMAEINDDEYLQPIINRRISLLIDIRDYMQHTGRLVSN